MARYLLGFDVGSSSVKASLINADSGALMSAATSPATEMAIITSQPGWAEQHPDTWWENLKEATRRVMRDSGVQKKEVVALGIAYQMHGLVAVDKDFNVLRNAIIWCDSRAVTIGEDGLRKLGEEYCREHLLNSPGNFTASKLKWVKELEPHVYSRIHKFLLPGDYIALKLTGEATTTAPGLSEGVMWDFKQRAHASRLFGELGIDQKFIPDIVPTFGTQGKLTSIAAEELGLAPGTPLCYRAGDQPNNAFSLNVLNPGEVAANAGTSGVVYAVVDKLIGDKASRVNTFLHVNDSREQSRLGVLLCVNGTGSMNSWLRRTLHGQRITYEAMNRLAAEAPAGSSGLTVLPFGNGAERMLDNRVLGASVSGLDLTRHQLPHLCRAVQEGIVFALGYGFEILRELQITPRVIRAGKANMFQSEVFCETFAHVTGAVLELYNIDGAQGAARGAGVGIGTYADPDQAFKNLTCIGTYTPKGNSPNAVDEAYQRWKNELHRQLES